MEDLEDTQDFDEDALTDVVPLDAVENSSGGKGNESVDEGDEKSNNDSSPLVHYYIPKYKYQRINVNQLKDKLRKKKNLCMVKKY